MVYTKDTALDMVRGRLDILPGNKTRDPQLSLRIDDAAARLRRMGIAITFGEAEEEGKDTGADDLMLLVDLTVWSHQNRDKGEDDPLWLRRRLRERWINERRDAT